MIQFSKKEEIEEKENYVVEEDFNLSATEGQMGEKEGWKGKLENFLGGIYFVPLIIILVAVIAFSLGRISGLQEKKAPVRILDNLSLPSTSVNTSPPNPSPKLGEGSSATTESGNQSLQNAGAVGASSVGGQVVASKNGTKYHYPWCGGAKQISEKNLITFNSIEAARAAGYTPAANCKGLK